MGEPDWATLLYGLSAQRESFLIAQKLSSLLHQIINNPGIGRQLPLYFHKCGLAEVTCKVETVIMPDQDDTIVFPLENNLKNAIKRKLLTPEEAHQFRLDVEESIACGYYASLSFFVVSGRKQA